MSRRKQSDRIHKQKQRAIERRRNKTLFKALLGWLIPEDVLFTEDRFDGNIKWTPEQLAQEAVIWAWQDTRNRSLANAVRALRKCMRNLNKYADPSSDLLSQLSGALVQKYNNRTDKKARYRPKNPDKKALGEPKVRKLNREEREKLRKISEQIAA